MARKMGRKPVAAETPPTLSFRQAIELLQRQIEKGDEILAKRPVTSEAEHAWKAATRHVLVLAFGSDSPNVGSVMSIGQIGIFCLGGGNEQQWEAERANNLQKQLTVLRELIAILEIQTGPEWKTQAVPESENASRQVNTYHFHGEVSMAKQEVNVGGSVNVGGHFVVADSVRDSFNVLSRSKAGADVQQMVCQLGEAVVEMSKSLTADKQQEVAQDFNTLTTEAAKDTPRKSYLKLAADGLVAIATTAGNVAVTGLVGALLKSWGIG